MKQHKNNTIKKTPRAIACLLLTSQIITSCGGHEILLPLDQQTTMQEPTCIDDDHSQLDTQTTTLIDGTPLKLGQPEIQFAWDNEKGLQAFAKYPSLGSMAALMPIQTTPLIKDVNGNSIPFCQLDKDQANFIVRGLRWGLTKAGELQERGVRVNGGMGKKGKDTGKREVAGKGDRKGASSGKVEAKQGRDGGKERVLDKRVGKKGGDNDKGAKQDKEYQADSRSTSSQGKGSIHEAEIPGIHSRGNGEKDANSNKKGLKTPSSVSESSVSKVSSRDTRHTDCSDNSQQEIYHNIVNGVVKDFFRDHFKTSPYLPNPTLQKASDTDTSTDASTPTIPKASDIDTSIDASTHTFLAKIHNRKKEKIDSHVTRHQFLQKHLVDQKTGQLRGLNVVIASITFFDKDNNEIIRTYIKSDSDFLSPYKDKSITDKLLRKNRHKELIDEFNKSLASFLTKHPDILNPKVKVKRDDEKDAGEEIDNPLLSEGKYNTTNLIYDEIKKNIIKALDAAEKDTKKYGGFRRIEEKSEEERIILKSIVSARRHSEEALAGYMRSNEFYNQLDELLKEKIKELGKQQDQQSTTACLAIDRIRIDVHSTKESCLPCQITLRCVRHALEEKFLGKDIAAAMEAGYAEKEAREKAEKEIPKVLLYISSQRGYNHDRTTPVSTTPKAKDQIEVKDEYNFPIQYQYNENLSKFELSDDDKKGMEGKLTTFIDGIWEHKHELDDSLNGSATQEENKQLKAQNQALATVLEDKKAEAEQAKAEARQKAAEIAKNMLATGNLKTDFIANMTGLSLQEVCNLQLELSATKTCS